MLDSNKTKTIDDDIVLETDGVLAEISSESFVDCIGGSLEEIIKQNEKAHEKKMMVADKNKRKEA